MSNQKLLSDSFLISSGRMLSRFLGLISTFVVARLLVPEDYAVIATAMIVQDLALRLQDVGFNQNIISSKDPSKAFISTVFWTRSGLSFVLSLLVFFSAPWVANLLNSPSSEAVIRVICWCILLGSTINVNVVLAMKHGNFMPEFKINVVSKILSVILTICLAYYLNNYWALAIGMLFSSALMFLLSYVVCSPYQLQSPSKVIAGEVFGYSKWYLFLQSVDFTISKLFIFSIGRYIGERMLGAYSLMVSVGFMYSLELAAAIDKANLTHLVKKVGISSEDDIKKEIFKNLNYVYNIRDVMLIPVYVYVFFYSEFVVSLLLGSTWVFADEIIQLIAVSAIITSYNAPFYTTFNAVRLPKMNFYLSCYRLSGFCLAAYLGVQASSVSVMQLGAIATELGLFFGMSIFGLFWYGPAILFILSRLIMSLSILCVLACATRILSDNDWVASFMYLFACLLYLFLRYLLRDPVLKDCVGFIKKNQVA